MGNRRMAMGDAAANVPERDLMRATAIAESEFLLEKHPGLLPTFARCDQASSTILDVGPLVLQEVMPLSRLADDAYIWLLPMISPLPALRTKYG